jgi:hypothetical protein
MNTTSSEPDTSRHPHEAHGVKLQMPREKSEKLSSGAELEAGADELEKGRKGKKQAKRKLEEKDQREQGIGQMMIDGGFATGYTKKRKRGLSISVEEKNEKRGYIRADKLLKSDPKIRSVSQQRSAQIQNTSRKEMLWEAQEELDFENETCRVNSTNIPTHLSSQVTAQSLTMNNIHIQRNTDNQIPQKLNQTSVTAKTSSVRFPVTFTQELDDDRKRNNPTHRVKAQKRKRGSFPFFTANGFQPSITERSFDSKFDNVSLSTQVLQDAADNDSDTAEEDFTAIMPSVAIDRARGNLPPSRTLVGSNESLTFKESSCRRSSQVFKYQPKFISITN